MSAETDGERDVRRLDTADDLEISVHHNVRLQHRRHYEEYEIHAGHADVLEVPFALAELAETVTGVDIESDKVRCAAEIRVIDQ